MEYHNQIVRFYSAAMFTTILLLMANLGSPAIAADPFLFDAPLLLDIGTSPFGNILDDLDGDGHLDLAVKCRSDRTVDVLLGVGDGTFTPGVSYSTSGRPGYLSSGDLDSDGDTDLLVLMDEDDLVLVLLNNGNGSFTSGGSFAAGNEPYRSTLSDLDNDSDLDLVVVSYGSRTTSVLLGNGDGSFAGPATIPAGDAPRVPLVADLTGDAVPDLVIANYFYDYYYEWWEFWSEVWILPGNGDGTFAAGTYFTTEESITEMDLCDLDGDTVLDLVTLGSGFAEDHGEYWTWGILKTYHGLGNGTFEPAVVVDSGDHHCLEVLDLDRDGTLDIVSGDAEKGVLFFPGAPDGSFDWPLVSNLGQYHDDLAFGDLNEDGLTDLVTSLNQDVGVLLGRGHGLFRGAEGQFSGRNNHAMILDDLDGDGDLDAAATGPGYLATVFENTGWGFFADAEHHIEAYHGEQIKALDLNEDGVKDLAVISDWDPCLTVLLGQGQLEFGDPDIYGAGLKGRSIDAADLNGDQHVDIVFTTSHDIRVMRGDGSAGLVEIGVYTTGSDGWHNFVVIEELNGDGHPDMVVIANRYQPAYTSDILVFFGAGDGSFTGPVNYLFPYYAYMAAAGDLDGDGHQDLAVACEDRVDDTTDAIALLFGNGDGTLADPLFIQAGSGTSWVDIVDIDMDGALDLLGVHSGSVSVHLGNGSGGFSAFNRYSAGTGLSVMAHGDLDGDGDADLIASGSSLLDPEPVTVLRNRTVDRENSQAWIVSGPGAGPANPPIVRLFALPETSVPVAEWTAYGATGYGVNVAAGDLDADGAPEILTGPGPGTSYGPHVRAFRLDGTPIHGFGFLAYGTHRYGVNIAAGDLSTGLGDEIVTGPGPGQVFGPHVRGWKWNGAGQAQSMFTCSFFAYGTPKWGVNVAVGDLDGRFPAEIVTGPGPGSVYGPHVRAFDVYGTTIQDVSFFAYGTLQYGVRVACGDIDGDGIDEIITGPGPGPMFAPHVRGWNWDGVGPAEPIGEVNFFAYAQGGNGVNVSCADLDGDGVDEILTGRGPGPGLDCRVRGWNFDGETLSMMPGIDFLAWEHGILTHGATVAGASW